MSWLALIWKVIEEPPTDGTAEKYGCLSVAKFKRPVHKIINGRIRSFCKGEYKG